MKKYLWIWLAWIILFCRLPVSAQNPDKMLSMTEALQIASANYLIQSKVNYTRSSAEAVEAAKKVALPDFILAGQTAYGTLNGVNGLGSGLPGITTISASARCITKYECQFRSIIQCKY